MLSKSELKKQLKEMGISIIAGNYICKADIEKVVAAKNFVIESGETKIATFMPKFKQLEYWKDPSSTTTVHCENKAAAKKIIDKSGIEQELKIIG